MYDSQGEKEGLNKDQKFFCCPNDNLNSCHFFKWVPDESSYTSYQSANFVKIKEEPKEQYLTTEFINDFANKLTI